MSDSSNQPPVPSSWSDAEDCFDSWKEIALYLDRDLSTVRRWEKEEGLPVHRHVHNKRSTVYASRSEIDTWLANRGSVLGNDRPGWFRFFSENRRILAAVTAAALLLLATLVTRLDFQEREWSTSFPQALELFKKAEALMIEGRSGPAEELLKQAIAKDPEFASAHIFLARAIRDQDKPADAYMKHAEQAVQLAGTISDRERYYIQGSYSEMKGEFEKAIHAYGALLSLYPDHFWANRNLAIELTRVGEEHRALTYWLRCADLRPNSFDYARHAAFQLLLNGDLARAKTYWGRALDLMTPEDVERNTKSALQLMWFPAFDALLHTDPETALREADRLSGTFRSFEERGYFNYGPTGAFYLTLGKIGLAKEWFAKADIVDSRRHYFLAAIAYVEEDYEAMTEHLRQWLDARESLRRTRGRHVEPSRTRRLRDQVPLRNVFLLLARGGLLSEAEELFSSRELGLPNLPDARRKMVERRRDILRGVLALSGANRIIGIRILENILASFGPGDSSATLYFMGTEILAQAWTEQGKSDEAIQVLKEALEKESRLLIEQSLLTGPLWLRLQAQLARLYSEMGRDEDARKIEDKLRRLLALADPDHPILRQLNRTQDLALREPAN